MTVNELVILSGLVGLALGCVLAYIESKYKCKDKLLFITRTPYDFSSWRYL